MRLVSVLSLAMLASACAPKSDAPAAVAHDASAPLSSSTLDSVKAVDSAFAAGMNAKDTAAVFAVYADDAKILPPDSPILDKAGAHPLIAGFIAAGAGDFVLSPKTVYGVGDIAYIVGTVSFKIGSAAQSSKYAEVLRRGSDGRWRYVVDMFSDVAAPSAAPPMKKN